jgi:hypothetical protein
MLMRWTSQSRWSGIALLAALALHAWYMGRPDLPHMLWSCHVATFVLAVGILVRVPILVSAGFLFHLAIGLPAWSVEIILTRGTFGGTAVIGRVVATSILVHMLPIVAGMLFLGFRKLTLRAVPLAWLIQVGMIPISRSLTPAEFNVNLSHAVWPQLAGTFPRLWVFQLAASLVCLTSLLVVWALWNSMAARDHPYRPAP